MQSIDVEEVASRFAARPQENLADFSRRVLSQGHTDRNQSVKDSVVPVGLELPLGGPGDALDAKYFENLNNEVIVCIDGLLLLLCELSSELERCGSRKVRCTAAPPVPCETDQSEPSMLQIAEQWYCVSCPPPHSGELVNMFTFQQFSLTNYVILVRALSRIIGSGVATLGEQFGVMDDWCRSSLDRIASVTAENTWKKRRLAAEKMIVAPSWHALKKSLDYEDPVIEKQENPKEEQMMATLQSIWEHRIRAIAVEVKSRQAALVKWEEQQNSHALGLQRLQAMQQSVADIPLKLQDITARLADIANTCANLSAERFALKGETTTSNSAMALAPQLFNVWTRLDAFRKYHPDAAIALKVAEPERSGRKGNPTPLSLNSGSKGKTITPKEFVCLEIRRGRYCSTLPVSVPSWAPQPLPLGVYFIMGDDCLMVLGYYESNTATPPVPQELLADIAGLTDNITMDDARHGRTYGWATALGAHVDDFCNAVRPQQLKQDADKTSLLNPASSQSLVVQQADCFIDNIINTLRSRAAHIISVASLVNSYKADPNRTPTVRPQEAHLGLRCECSIVDWKEKRLDDNQAAALISALHSVSRLSGSVLLDAFHQGKPVAKHLKSLTAAISLCFLLKKKHGNQQITATVLAVVPLIHRPSKFYVASSFLSTECLDRIKNQVDGAIHGATEQTWSMFLRNLLASQISLLEELFDEAVAALPIESPTLATVAGQATTDSPQNERKLTD